MAGLFNHRLNVYGQVEKWLTVQQKKEKKQIVC